MENVDCIRYCSDFHKNLVAEAAFNSPRVDHGKQEQGGVERVDTGETDIVEEPIEMGQGCNRASQRQKPHVEKLAMRGKPQPRALIATDEGGEHTKSEG